MSNPRHQIDIIDKHVAALLEHFDSVQILCSAKDPDGTRAFARGGGDWYARKGLAHDFIKRDEAQTLAREIVEAEEP